MAAKATTAAPELVILLAGNPNSGKTSLFNWMAGAHQHVGNYPGVTVEKKSARFTRDGIKIELVDLPGVYSLLAASPEEVIARDEILSGSAGVVATQKRTNTASISTEIPTSRSSRAMRRSNWSSRLVIAASCRSAASGDKKDSMAASAISERD